MKWLSGTLFLDRIKNHLDSVILQKYHSLSNQSFKQNLAHMLSINLTPTLSCESRFCMFIINSYYTKSKHLYSLDSLLKDLVIYCCGLFDLTGNTVDETVQCQHLNQYIKFIYIENVVRLVLFILLWCQNFNLTGGFFISLVIVIGRGIIFTCSAEYYTCT